MVRLSQICPHLLHYFRGFQTFPCHGPLKLINILSSIQDLSSFHGHRDHIWKSTKKKNIATKSEKKYSIFYVHFIHSAIINTFFHIRMLSSMFKTVYYISTQNQLFIKQLTIRKKKRNQISLKIYKEIFPYVLIFK